MSAALRQAAEALVDSCYWHSPTGKPELNDGGYVEVHPAHVTALRSALAASAAEEERASAAVEAVEDARKAADDSYADYRRAPALDCKAEYLAWKADLERLRAARARLRALKEPADA